MSDAVCPPFFIVGCGRSGTTLLRAMLNHHRDVGIPPEALSLIDFLRARRCSIAQLRRALLRDYEVGAWRVPLDEAMLSDCQTIPELIARVHRAYAEHWGKRVWGHKTPRFVRYTDTLMQAFPEAGFVHMVRDPRAVVRSFIQSRVHQSNALYAAERWQRDTAAGWRLCQQHPEKTHELRYEDLVLHPDLTLRSLCAFLGLDFDPNMLAYHHDARNEYGVYHQETHAKLGTPPDPQRIDVWKQELHPGQVHIIDHITADLAARYGYERVSSQPPSSWQLRCCRWERTLGLVRQTYFSLARRGSFLPNLIMRKYRLGLQRDLWDINY